MNKFLSVSGSVLLVIGVMGGIAYLAYHQPWKRWDPVWTLRKGEAYEIKFAVNAGSKSTATVYLNSESRNKKLSSKDVITINGQPMKEIFYNSQANGYKYTIDVGQSKEFVLSIKREGESEIKKTVSSRTFAPSIPEVISRNKGAAMDYLADTIPVEGRLIISFSVISDGSLIENDKWTRAVFVDAKIEGSKLIIDPQELKRIKTGKAMMLVGMVFEQADGEYGVSKEKEVEVID